MGRSGAGIYVDTLTSSMGCDSIRTLNLTVNPLSASTIGQIICYGESYLGRTETGRYVDTLTSVSGCDSVRTLNLIVNPLAASSISQTICYGDNYLGRTATGLYVDTLTSFNGCDSMRTLNLIVNPLLASNLNQTICYGGSYLGRSETGVYVDTLTGFNGCDSVRTLNLVVNPVITSVSSQNICAGTAYQFNGQYLAQAGVYFDTLEAVTGCDSIYILSLFVDSGLTPTVIRLGDSLFTGTFASYQWLLNDSVIVSGANQSLVLTQNGNYRVVVTSAGGCSDTSSVLSVFGLGITELISGTTKLFPNPNNGIFTLEFTDVGTREIEITDAYGKIIATAKVEKSQMFNFNELAPGIYFLHINQDNETKSLKFNLIR